MILWEFWCNGRKIRFLQMWSPIVLIKISIDLIRLNLAWKSCFLVCSWRHWIIFYLAVLRVNLRNKIWFFSSCLTDTRNELSANFLLSVLYFLTLTMFSLTSYVCIKQYFDLNSIIRLNYYIYVGKNNLYHCSDLMRLYQIIRTSW